MVIKNHERNAFQPRPRLGNLMHGSTLDKFNLTDNYSRAGTVRVHSGLALRGVPVLENTPLYFVHKQHLENPSQKRLGTGSGLIPRRGSKLAGAKDLQE